ncbi:MAG: hypothetical protein J6Y37_01350 [Paludibacteraceae bacterium]|nr:hypothetical protein [Paludibacteraceae bacterium]
MKVIKTLGFITAFLALAVGLFFAYATLADYQPQEKEEIFRSERCDTIKVGDTISILSWNIGYAGLDKNMDFFYDGGTKVRPEEEATKNNINQIANFVEKNDSINFIFLQEIDQKAKRSYYFNQVEEIDKRLPSHSSYFAMNYNVKYVPLPIHEPMGSVISGINTLANITPRLAERGAFPFNFEWPRKVFLLDRCFLALYYPLDNGKELVLINTHNSAFDDNGAIRKAELNLFRNFLMSEYDKGNYVITGGDFNQCPLNLNTDFGKEPFDFDDYVAIPDTLLPNDWHYVFDNSVPSNRRVVEPYQYGKTKITLIDFFITSPNVDVNYIKCMDLKFENSDHNPIIGSFTLKKEETAELSKEADNN